MEKETSQAEPNKSVENDQTESAVTKKPWDQPKLTFVEPRLSKHGELERVTGQFLGAFSPRP